MIFTLLAVLAKEYWKRLADQMDLSLDKRNSIGDRIRVRFGKLELTSDSFVSNLRLIHS
jgi:hypothetical protein